MGWQVVYQPILFAGNTIINDTGVFTYSSTPAFGNLIYSETQLSGTDQFGNTFLPGAVNYFGPIAAGAYLALQTYQGQLAWYQAGGAGGAYTQFATVSALLVGGITAELTLAAAQIVNVNTADLHFDDTGTSAAIDWSVNAGGELQYVNNTDGNTYKEGSFTTKLAATVLINATTPITIISVPVGARQYWVNLKIIYLSGSTAASAGLQVNQGTATVSNMVGVVRRGRNSTNVDNIVPVNQNSALGSLALAFNANELETYEFEGLITFSAAGTFIVSGTTSVAADTWSAATNSYVKLEPV